KKDGTPGTKVQPDPFPICKWVTIKPPDRTRDPNDLEDRAAKFLADQNTLLINADFRVFADMITSVFWSARNLAARSSRSFGSRVLTGGLIVTHLQIGNGS